MFLFRQSVPHYIVLIVFSFIFFLSPATTHAATDTPGVKDDGYKAVYKGQSLPDPVSIQAGDTKTITVRFKNIGSKTWESGGAHPVTAFTMNPRYHTSQFRGPNWHDGKQTATIKKTTTPGETAELAIDFTAPNRPGTYREEFHLAAENYSWISGGSFWIEFHVAAPVPTPKSPPANAVASSTVVSVRAKQLLLSQKQVAAQGGEQIKLVIGFQNRSAEPWHSYSIFAKDPNATRLASQDTLLTFADESWQNNAEVLRVNQSVTPGAVTRDTIYFRAPAKAGLYTARFYLAVDGETMEQVAAEVGVNVTSDAPEHYTPPAFGVVAPVPTATYRLANEPRIRVGIRKDHEGELGFTSNDDDYYIFDGEDQVGILPRGERATLAFVGEIYFFSSVGVQLNTIRFIRLAPANNPQAIFVLDHFDRRVSWKGPKNFNAYHGALEYRTTEKKNGRYLINELLFEDYVKGIAENSNGAPEEYLKAQSVAQRTYAYYIKEKSDKHDSRYFDVVASTGDQLYLGVESEKIMPRFVAATEATRGQMVLYNNDIAITPYYGNSDGRTRSWTEVWGSSVKPWLLSVKAGYDKGKHMNGHGVGMSQLDASARAKVEGLDWQALIKYYYTGVEVERIYE